MSLSMTVEKIRDALVGAVAKRGELLYSRAEDQVLVQVRQPLPLLDLADHLHNEGFYLVTVVANDERELEDRCFKLYYMFSHPTADLFVLVEYLLLPPQPQTYPSLYGRFAAVDCFEREIRDMLGLRPDGDRERNVAAGSWLHDPYPSGLHPLRRDRTVDKLRQEVADHVAVRQGTGAGTSEACAQDTLPGGPAAPGGDGARPAPVARSGGADGRIIPVGPVHAGIIEPGQFRFEAAGEAVDALDIRLGYTHRGLERLFQSGIHLLNGWRLAEQASGDSSFAHSLAYCRAAEALTQQPAPPAAERVRGLLLELERVHNHVADIAALAEDVALGRIAAELSVVREQMVRLNTRLTGHRYLRRVNRPGGVELPGGLDVADIRDTLHTWLGRFHELALRLKGRAAFRDRTIGVGTLTSDEAVRLGVTGLVARASGVPRDFRWDHPNGVYGDAGLRPYPEPARRLTDPAEACAGDVYARFLTRVEEVNGSQFVIERILEQWESLRPRDRTRLLDRPRIQPENNYTFAVGYAEGFRGDVVYWLMQDKMNRIYRCKIRDPSMLNWPGLRVAVLPKVRAAEERGGAVNRPERNGRPIETMLADFPLVNKSFNLSYSGNDL